MGKWLRWGRRVWRRYWFYLICQFIAAVFVFRWIGYAHLPWAGVAVAGVAGLAAIMSIHPDLRPWQKVIYILLIGAFLVTEFRAIRKDRLDSIQAALTQEERFKDLRDSQSKLFSLFLTFVANPPKGITQDQVLSVVKNIAKQQQTPAVLTNSMLRIMAPSIVDQMAQLAHEWNDADLAIQIRFQEKMANLPPKAPEKDSQAAMAALKGNRDSLNTNYSNKLRPIMRNVELIREDLAEGRTKNDDDKKSDVLIARVLSGENIGWQDMEFLTKYMRNLVQKLFPASSVPV
jgi:hypothetical protein